MQSSVYLEQGDLAMADGVEVCRLEFLVGGFYEIPFGILGKVEYPTH